MCTNLDIERGPHIVAITNHYWSLLITINHYHIYNHITIITKGYPPEVDKVDL